MYRAWLLLALLLVSVTTARADGPWAGTWDTRWRDGGARMELKQDGDHVVGEYPLYGGRIEGTASGDRLNGHWTEGKATGAFVFVLDRKGNSFAGRYDTGEWWTGARTDKPDPTPRPNLTNPRATMQSFTVASNLARAGLPDARGTAAEAIDFGPDAASLSRAERLDQTIALFDLVDLTTFRIWSIPSEATGDTLTVQLPQSGTDVTMPLTFVRDTAGTWHIRMPSPAEMAAARHALLAAFGGKPPATDAYRRLASPRDTMRAFIEGTAGWNGNGRALAMSTLDLSGIPEVLRTVNGELAAQYLRRVVDRIGLIGLQSIPNYVPDRQAYVHFLHPAGRIVIAPYGEGADTRWKFTAQTVADIDQVYMATENLQPPVATPPGLIPQSTFFTWRGFVRTHAPVLLGQYGELEYWQILAALLTMTTMLSLGFLAARLAFKALHRFVGPDIVPQPRLFAFTLGLVIAVVFASRIVPALGIPEQIRQYSYPIVGSIVTVAGATAAWLLLGVAGRLVELGTARTTTAADDILVTLILAAMKLGIVIGVVLSIAYFLSLPTAGMLAGLGIGGVAVAFASRETISNVFGAGILVTDRPFGRGDWISAGEVEGAVEHLGIRSTRVRTAQDSLMVVPNGKLADSTINNLGTRRHRLVRSKLLVTAGGTPQRLDAFVASVRQRMTDDPLCITARSDVGVIGITEQGIEIDVTTYLDVTNSNAERAAKHALMLDIVRLAASHGLTLGAGMSASVDTTVD
jgi:small-conductance mechanosensitive channel